MKSDTGVGVDIYIKQVTVKFDTNSLAIAIERTFDNQDDIRSEYKEGDYPIINGDPVSSTTLVTMIPTGQQWLPLKDYEEAIEAARDIINSKVRIFGEDS